MASNALASVSVTAMSPADGKASPCGWLCARTTAVAFRNSAFYVIRRIGTVELLTTPSDTNTQSIIFNRLLRSIM